MDPREEHWKQSHHHPQMGEPFLTRLVHAGWLEPSGGMGNIEKDRIPHTCCGYSLLGKARSPIGPYSLGLEQSSDIKWEGIGLNCVDKN